MSDRSIEELERYYTKKNYATQNTVLRRLMVKVVETAKFQIYQ